MDIPNEVAFKGMAPGEGDYGRNPQTGRPYSGHIAPKVAAADFNIAEHRVWNLCPIFGRKHSGRWYLDARKVAAWKARDYERLRLLIARENPEALIGEAG